MGRMLLIGLFALVAAAGAAPEARAQEIYQTEIGRSCIAQWIADTSQKLNAYQGEPEFNSRKPWSINQYGLFVARGISSVAAPDDWAAKGATRESWMWLSYTSELRYPDWRNTNFNRAGVEGLRWYVRECVRRAGGTGSTSGGLTTRGPTIGGVNPCRAAADPDAARFDDTVWEFGRADGSIIASALTLLPGGRIGGYSHPNESRWTVRGGYLVFCRSDDTPSAVFYNTRTVGGRRILQGPYFRADGQPGGSDHVLREVGSGTGTGLGTAQGVDLPGSDYYSFRLRRAEPALCRAACEADARCRAWTYVRPGAAPETPRCWLKDAVPPAVMSDCCTSGTIP